MTRHFKVAYAILAIVGIIALAAAILFYMGRTPTYQNGPIALWSGDVLSDQNSQQVADPYTLTHLIHGMGFYWLLRLLLRRMPVAERAVLAVALEAAWEVFENTDFVINRYREATISLDYYGDSILNSVFDMLIAALGFLLAAKFPVRVTIGGVLLLEVILALWIRDSLFLNILMLIYPIDAVKTWQGGG